MSAGSGALPQSISMQTIPLPARDLVGFKDQFPIFSKHPNILFFDNASTTQKPARVIESLNQFYSSDCANVGRGSYSWSTLLARAVEDTRQKVGRFINAAAAEIVFTSGATDSLNTLAIAWGLPNLKTGDEVMICLNDHQSAVLPWFNLQRLLAKVGIDISLVPFEIHDVGEYSLKSIEEKKTRQTRLIAISHIHHSYGMYMEVAEVRRIVGPEVLISLDASQSAGHTRLDTRVLDVDFVSFSAHKMFAANGTGVLWIHPKLHESLSPVKLGGKSPVSIGASGIDWTGSSFPQVFEAGTPNVPGILSLSSAIDLIDSYGIDSIEDYISQLTQYLYQRLKDIPGIRFARGVGRCGCSHGYGIISFGVDNISSADLAFALGNEDIFVRSGNQCMTESKEDDYLRVSLHAYNNQEEIERFVATILAILG